MILTAVFTEGTLKTENIISPRPIEIFKGTSEGNSVMFEILRAPLGGCWGEGGGTSDSESHHLNKSSNASMAPRTSHIRLKCLQTQLLWPTLIDQNSITQHPSRLPAVTTFTRRPQTHRTSSALTFFGLLSENNFDFYFLPSVPPHRGGCGGRGWVGVGVGGQGLIKGWSRWNMGERYLGVSQPSCREARYKKFRAAAAAATGELPPPSLCHFRYRLLLHRATPPPRQPSLSDIITTLSIFSPPPRPGPSIPISSFPFPPSSPSCLSSTPGRA